VRKREFNFEDLNIFAKLKAKIDVVEFYEKQKNNTGKLRTFNVSPL
jgi:hypothetical protein